MNPIAEDILMHYGVKRRSGRYPWGSGKEPYQHSGDFLSRVEGLQKEGFSEKQIADTVGLSTTDLRMQIRVAKHERRQLEADRARSLREDGLSLNEIAKKMGYENDSSIRSLLNENTAANKNKAKQTAEILKKELEEKGVLDVGAGVERELGVSPGVMKEALFILETEGYRHLGIGLQQPTNVGKQTTTEIIAKTNKDDRELMRDLYADPALIKSVQNYHSTDGGATYNRLEYPQSVNSKRIEFVYGDKGGSDKDGVIELRRGVEDLDLGNSHYAQVRILVDGTHYLKGMAMYADDLPDGVDIRFNTNKKSGTPKESVMKSIKEDPSNPFGAAIKANGQTWYIGSDGKKHLSAINKIKEEGDWDKMSKNLSSQFLSKQPIQLIKKQLDLTYKDSAAEYDEIMSLTNPTIKKKMLLDFADACDGAAVHLKAAALPRQSTQVILPLTSMKETEIYAPSYKNGEKVALVRYPHGGTFEIPVLTVNNKNKTALSVLGNVMDAVGINPRVAERLSGADFDGDQVVVIPTNSKVRIKSTPAFKELEHFNPKDEYPEVPGMKYMTKSETQKQMGVVSNLITDMTLKGAGKEELIRAVKHSMVVIDAEKHKLNYKQSEKDNGIAELKEKWQGYETSDGRQVGGASTLLSRRKQDTRVPERQGSGRIDPDTGKVTYKESGRTYFDKKTGEWKPATTKVKTISLVDDVRILSSGTSQENAYADYANRMKALANQARKSYLSTGNLKYDSNAATTYKKEADHLKAQLNTAAKNAPRERQALAIANSRIKAKIQDNPGLEKDKKELKKVRQIEMENARAEVGAGSKKNQIKITDREWEAIQAGAISDSMLTQILKYTDTDRLRELATPKATQMSAAKISKAKAYAASGFTIAEIAEALGVSSSTVSKYLNG